MTDIFFSYRSTDRDRVRPIRDAFVKQGFDVFWDQEVPSGVDWDTWIRQHLAKSKCAVVFWSAASVESDNVRHEATVAKRQGKLIAVLLEPLSADQFPMGLYSQQAINLADWSGNRDDPEWSKLNHDVETKLTPAWIRGRIFELEAELAAEHARCEEAESRSQAMHAQIAREVQAHQALKREFVKATGEMKAFTDTIDTLNFQRSDLAAQVDYLSRRNREMDDALVQRAEGARSQKAEKNTQPAREFSGSMRAAIVGSIVAALFTVGFWLQSAIRPQIPAPAQDARKSAAPAQSASPAVLVEQSSSSGLFNLRTGIEAAGSETRAPAFVKSIDECEQRCRESTSCTTFTYHKLQQSCYSYSKADTRPNDYFITGFRK